MERMTMWYDGNHAICENETCNLGNCPFADPVCERVDQIIDRLAEIENILGDDYDLDHLKTMIAQYKKSEKIRQMDNDAIKRWIERSITTNGMSVDRLKEVCKAEEENRCVIIPCKVGDKIYKLFCGEVLELEVERIVCWLSGHRKMNARTEYSQKDWKGFEIDFSDFGKTVFLKREDADSALKGENHE